MLNSEDTMCQVSRTVRLVEALLMYRMSLDWESASVCRPLRTPRVFATLA